MLRSIWRPVEALLLWIWSTLAVISTTYVTKPVRKAAVQSLIALAPRLPKHVAFIMDGNRRWARRHGWTTFEGHLAGFGALESMLESCLELDVRAVTVYAFSIENFHRSPKEVDDLMQLLKEKLLKLSLESEMIKKYDVSIRILGKLSLLPPDVLEIARQVMADTSCHQRSVLNICCPYTSMNEMETAFQMCESTYNKPFSIDELEQQLMTWPSLPLDILVRTSGETRLSDFLLWQTCDGTQIHFIDAMWPEFTFWHFLPILLDYSFNWKRRWTPKTI